MHLVRPTRSKRERRSPERRLEEAFLTSSMRLGWNGRRPHVMERQDHADAAHQRRSSQCAPLNRAFRARCG